MSIGMVVLVGAICLVVGVVGGFYIARKNFISYMEKKSTVK